MTVVATGSTSTSSAAAAHVDATGRLVVTGDVRTHADRPFADVLDDGHVLLVLLRHAGCTFCREALDDLRRGREVFERTGVHLAIVHQGTPEQGRGLLARYGLEDVAAVSDPERRLYAALDLRRGTLRQLFGPRVWWRGLVATLRGHLVGPLVGDGFQMPGVFLLDRGRIVRAHRHASADERPDYARLCTLDHVAEPPA